ncbi:MAG: hypothetical protein K5634_06590 [Sphaerochaetaceae bacterium]|nr:hypothetical protein [Sphaerochaetaceae bacterium]
MRKFNMFLVIGMMILFVVHGVLGSTQLFGAESVPSKMITHSFMTLVFLHMIVTAILTFRTLYALKKSGASYFRNNGLFWARRLSGFAIIIPMFMHFTVFSGVIENGAYRLVEFNTLRMISQILFVACLAVHIVSNIRPALISMGVKGTGKISVNLLVILSAILLISTVGFLFYYLVWIAL